MDKPKPTNLTMVIMYENGMHQQVILDLDDIDIRDELGEIVYQVIDAAQEQMLETTEAPGQIEFSGGVEFAFADGLSDLHTCCDDANAYCSSSEGNGED